MNGRNIKGFRADVIERATDLIFEGNIEEASEAIKNGYRFVEVKKVKREYSLEDKITLFFRDGFIDRYSGERLVNPGMLRVLSEFLQEEFPFHPRWKADECHLAYWYLMPSLDHVVPVALGGKDIPANWVTTSGFRNQAKGMASIEDMGWKIYEGGDIRDWDGLSEKFVRIVEDNPQLLTDKTIREWYNATKKIMSKICK